VYTDNPLNVPLLSFLMVWMCFEDFSLMLCQMFPPVILVLMCFVLGIVLSKNLLSIKCICKVPRELGAVSLNLEELRTVVS